jgi:hypothetical protein
MSRRIVAAAFLYAGLAAACGGDGSEVGESLALVSLDAGQIDDVCAYVIEVQGPQRAIHCGDVTITIGRRTTEACTGELREARAAHPSCTATVRDAERCAEDFAGLSDAEWCSDEMPLPSACQPLLACGILIGG